MAKTEVSPIAADIIEGLNAVLADMSGESALLSYFATPTISVPFTAEIVNMASFVTPVTHEHILVECSFTSSRVSVA